MINDYRSLAEPHTLSIFLILFNKYMHIHVKPIHVLNLKTFSLSLYTFSRYYFSPYDQYAKGIFNTSSGTRKTIVESKKEGKDQESIQSSITPDPGYSLSCSRGAVERGFIIHLRGCNNTYLSAYEINHSQLSATICVYR